MLSSSCRLHAWVFALFLGLTPIAIFSQAPQPSAARLRFALILTRHGVRSPTWTAARLNAYSREPWPEWGVAPGELTAHGKRLTTLFGAYYREMFASEGLLPKDGCSAVSSAYIYADTDQRTRETGAGLAEGLLPGCAAQAHSLPPDQRDPLFHPVGLVGKADSDLAAAAVAGRIGGNPKGLAEAYSIQLQAMQQILDGCSTASCTVGPGIASGKSLLANNASISSGTGDHLVEVKSSLSTAGSFAEDLQLEYLEGMPIVGWQHADAAAVRSLMALHAASEALVERTPYVAAVQGSNLLLHVLATLRQAQQQAPATGALGSSADKVTMLVGHDTNLANVAALIDAHWLIDGYQPDDAAPGGALVFELWQQRGQEDTVRVFYMVQTPEQMRNSETLSLENPPLRSQVFLPGCSQAEPQTPCPWPDFYRLVTKAADTDFASFHPDGNNPLPGR